LPFVTFPHREITFDQMAHNLARVHPAGFSAGVTGGLSLAGFMVLLDEGKRNSSQLCKLRYQFEPLKD
jgi:hypothetical protein